MKSPEFDDIALELVNITPSTKINTRFKLYYGSAGTGKTTAAMKEADGNCMVCHSAMLPSDLMEDFKFEEGKAAFQPSALYKAITEGKKIVLDEINLLPFESLRFLQSILESFFRLCYIHLILILRPVSPHYASPITIFFHHIFCILFFQLANHVG